jgi:hypothetical protein
MAYIGKEPIVGNFQKCDAITVVNGQAAYTLQVSSTNVVPESANHMLVSLNGILQAPVTSFSVSGSTLTFVSNLATGDVIDFVILLGNVLDLGTPSDGTVTNAKLAQDIISGETALASEPADTDEFLVSDAGTLKRIDYSLIKGGGKIGQVLQIQKVDTYSQTAASWTDITGLSIAITPSATTSKILVTAVVNASKEQGGGNGHFRLLRDSTVIGVSTNGSGYNGFGMTDQGVDGNTMSVKVNNYLDSPSSTSELTYKVQLYNITNSHTSYVNRRASGAGHGATSTITVMEVLA